MPCRPARGSCPIKRPLPTNAWEFLDAGEKPVYVGFGSMRTVAEESARTAIKAIRAQGRRVLIGRGWAGLSLIDNQDDCFVVGEVNQQELFGRAAAVVHHGGAGTTTTAARAGAPQLVVPQGRRPGRTGRAGWPNWASAQLTTVRRRPNTSLSTALRTVLTPDTRARASALAAEMSTHGATTAAHLLIAGSSAPTTQSSPTPSAGGT